MAGVKSARDWLGDTDGSQTQRADSNGSSPSDASSSVPARSDTELLNMLSIPKLELDKFAGDPLDYQRFMAIFDESVGSKVADDQIKLTRLLQYTTGQAKAAIKNCSLIGGSPGYSKARKILQSIFGNSILYLVRSSATSLAAGP